MHLNGCPGFAPGMHASTPLTPGHNALWLHASPSISQPQNLPAQVSAWKVRSTVMLSLSPRGDGSTTRCSLRVGSSVVGPS